jgi:[FeFe] hydrogenase H-cluster maturation GTPase HydF
VQNVPNSERVHIAIVGKRNAGKSSLTNALLGQDLCIVSEVAGTTTDPVKKAMELLPFGPIVLVDTAGIDDEGELGEKRISKTIKAISSANFIIVVVDARDRISHKELELIQYLKKVSLPFVVAVNKIEFGVNPFLLTEIKMLKITHFEISCAENVGIDNLKSKVIRLLPKEDGPPLIGDLVKQGDIVVLVVPIDLGAPKGRLILPQVQTIREALDEDTIVVVAKDKELRSVLNSLKNPPDLVITDSQAIMRVAADVPDSVKLTTFSILMARCKGNLPLFIRALHAVDKLEDGDKILIAEACSHHAQADDIGKVKIPRWLRLHSKKNLEFETSSGIEFPDDLSEFKLIVHCGGCMLTRHAMQTRIKQAVLLDIPIINYGVLISYMHGAVPRALLPFSEAVSEWNNYKKINIA